MRPTASSSMPLPTWTRQLLDQCLIGRRVRTGDHRLPVLCHRQLGQDIPDTQFKLFKSQPQAPSPRLSQQSQRKLESLNNSEVRVLSSSLHRLSRRMLAQYHDPSLKLERAIHRLQAVRVWWMRIKKTVRVATAFFNIFDNSRKNNASG